MTSKKFVIIIYKQFLYDSFCQFLVNLGNSKVLVLVWIVLEQNSCFILEVTLYKIYVLRYKRRCDRFNPVSKL